MANILKQPYTNEQYAEFAVLANENNKRIELYDSNAYALCDYEKLIDGEIVDLRNDDEYKKQNRLKDIEKELEETDKTYNVTIDTPVLYGNGQCYKPRYVQESYVLLLAADIFPITIWDASEINSTEMTKTDLLQLSMFLKAIAEPAFQERKSKRLELLLEKQKLEER